MPSISVVNRLETAAILKSYDASITGGGTGSGGGGTGPSGVDMPTTAPAGWVRYWAQDFNVNCDPGAFLATYGPPTTSSFSASAAAAGNGYVSAYPRSYFDTRSKNVASTSDGNYGRNDPANLSCVGGVMRMHIWWNPADTAAGNSTLPATPAGKLSCCNPIPKLSASTAGGAWGYLASMRTSVRCRVVIGTTRATTKVAWLQWPLSNKSTSAATAGIPDSTSSTGFRGGDGECDFPEQDGGSHADWFMHKQNALRTDTSSTPIYGNYQQTAASTVDFFDGNWHTWTLERVVGSYNTGSSTWVGQTWRAFADGTQVGSTLTSRVPMTPMRWALQTESTLSYSTALNTTVDYYIEVDWMTVDVPG